MLLNSSGGRTAKDGNLTLTSGKKWKWGPVYDGRVTFATGDDGTVRQKMSNQKADLCPDGHRSGSPSVFFLSQNVGYT